MLEPLYQPGVDQALDEIENDPERAKLWDSVVDTLTMICQESGSSFARRYQMAMAFPGHVIWRVPVPSGSEDRNYSVLWSQDGGDAVIHYVGPWPPNPAQ